MIDFNEVVEKIKQVRLDTIMEVREVLLRECDDVKWENKHSVDFVSRDTIRELPELMGYNGIEGSGIDHTLSKFSEDFVKRMYNMNPMANAVVKTLAQGSNVYKVIEMLLENYASLKRDWEILVTQGPRRSAQL